jgi:hypothetical protein
MAHKQLRVRIAQWVQGKTLYGAHEAPSPDMLKAGIDEGPAEGSPEAGQPGPHPGSPGACMASTSTLGACTVGPESPVKQVSSHA